MHEMHTEKKTMKTPLLRLLLALLAACVLVASAGSVAMAQGQGGKNVQQQLRQKFIPPRLLLKHADALGLTADQKSKLKRVMRETHAEVGDAQFDLREESYVLMQMLDDPKATDAKILAQADKVMQLEQQVKRRHMKMLLEVRRILTPEQLAKVEKFKAEQREKRKEKRRQQRGE